MEHAAATVDKAIDVLFFLHERAQPQGVTELGRALEIPKSSAHRLLVSLRRRGLVERDERGRYRPGIGLLALGLGVLEREPLVAAARTVLESAAEELGETFFVVAARGGRLTVLDKVEGTGFVRAAPRVGSTIPLHVTAVGKLYLAHAPQAVVDNEKKPRERAAARAVSAAQLEKELLVIRKRGYAENLGEWIEGMFVVAAPVFMHGRIFGAVATALPALRAERMDRRSVIATVMAAASRVGARLEGRQA